MLNSDKDYCNSRNYQIISGILSESWLCIRKITIKDINENFGEGALGKFLMDLKQTGDWQKSLNNVTGKTTGQTGQEIQDSLKSMVEQNKRWE